MFLWHQQGAAGQTDWSSSCVLQVFSKAGSWRVALSYSGDGWGSPNRHLFGFWVRGMVQALEKRSLTETKSYSVSHTHAFKVLLPCLPETLKSLYVCAALHSDLAAGSSSSGRNLEGPRSMGLLDKNLNTKC